MNLLQYIIIIIYKISFMTFADSFLRCFHFIIADGYLRNNLSTTSLFYEIRVLSFPHMLNNIIILSAIKTRD